jgi:peptide/nickel transport system permease protein
MIGQIARRLAGACLVVVISTFVAFIMFQSLGNPTENILAPEAGLEEHQQLRDRLGLDAPLFIRFSRFLANMARGEFGSSYRLRRPVAELLGERLPATIELVAVAMVVAVAIGIPLGLYAGVHPGTLGARVILSMSLFGAALPTFVTGTLLICIFSVALGVLPAFGRGEVTQIGWWSSGLMTMSGWRAIVLPALTLALFQLASIVRLVQAEMVAVLQTDHIRFARARGLPNRHIYWRYAVPNALPPVVSIIGLNFASMLAFAIVTESVFQWPGAGLLFMEAVSFSDIPVMSAYLVLVTLVFVATSLTVDLAAIIMDPRLRDK